MRSSSLITPTLLTFQNETIDNPKRSANIFNNYFSTIVITNENPNCFFLSPTDKEEIKLILSSLDTSKTSGLYSIPTKVLNYLKIIFLTNLLIYLIFLLQRVAFKLYLKLLKLFLSTKKSRN